MKTCVLFHYCEVNEAYRDNLLHFLLFGYLESVDYIIVVAGKSSVELPQRPNIKYVFTENRNNDYGGYCAAVSSGLSVDVYDAFIFVNSSVRGPYLPPYVGADWVTCFTRHLRDEVGLVGSTINILDRNGRESQEFKSRHGGNAPFSHVQTTAFALSRKALSVLLEAKLFSNDATLAKLNVVTDFEILMSQILIRAGWNIKCLLPEYNVVDYRQAHQDINPTSANGDPCYEGAYFGRSAHPHEVMFVKTNRNIFPMHFLEKMTYSMLMSYHNRPTVQLGPAVDAYVNRIVSATRFDEAMPSTQDRIGNMKLGEIVQSINKILSTT